MRKKIIYAITKSNLGGAQKYVYDLATALPPDQYEVIVLVGTDGDLVEKLKTENIPVIILGNLHKEINFFDDLSVFVKIFKIFRREKPDIVHLNSSKMGFIGAIAGRLARVPKIIFTGHGWAFNEDRSKFQKKAIYFLHLLTIALSHKTITVSEQTKNQIANGRNNKKIIAIRNGIDKINFLEKNAAREKILKKLPADLDWENRLWFGTISELHKNKGLKYIIEAWHLLKIKSDDRSTLPLLFIIGEGQRREKLQERIDRYRLNDLVFLLGQIPEAAKYLKAFDVFTLTSITEALPYSLLEAGQAGLPIIASGVGGNPEIITDMKNGILIRPKEPEEILKAVNFLLENKDKMTTFGQNIQNKIQSDFNLEKMITETITLYS